MPTAFTHALVGASLAQAGSAKDSRVRLAWILAALAALPDLDVIAFTLGIPYQNALGHRGFSHSLLFALLLGSGLALTKLGAGNRLRLGIFMVLAIASHGLLDAATDAGLGIGFFIPFDNGRYFLPFRPLATSSVSPVSFFLHPGRALSILANEALWVGLPTLSLLGLAKVVVRLRAAFD